VDDKQLEDLSYQIDNILIRLAQNNDSTALLLSSVFLARLMLLCDAVGAGSDFRKLCQEVSTNPLLRDEIPQEVVH
jgi:hypothetical protein